LRVFPAIEIDKSGTRHDELLLPAETFKKVVTLRHMLSLLNDSSEKTSTLIERLLKSKSNKDFLDSLSKGS
ncbi:transcription termination factor Rho, partial [Candidatus Gottesmanbacteria bacterium]|nr:transcription termination factor Rho [Candidatus Gottesmanbacteria bacterium]